MQANTHAQQAQQLSLFETGETVAEISVPPKATEAEVRDIGRAILALTRYYATKQPGQVQS